MVKVQEKKFISLVIPLRNEQKSVEELFMRARASLNQRYKDRWEILMIDDASTDDTFKIITRLSKEYPEIKPFNHKEKKGQAGGFYTGFNHAEGEYCITMDGDLQVMPEDLHLFTEKIEEGYDLVNGIRTARNHPFWIKVASRLYNIAMLFLFNCPVLDAASNFTAVRTIYVNRIRFQKNDHRYVIPIAMARGAKTIAEVAIRHYARVSGKSKYNALPKYFKGPFEIVIFWLKFKMGKYHKNSES